MAVMAYHYTSHLSASYQHDFSVISQYANYGKYGVHLFFIISGYVIYMTITCSKSLFHFVFSRFSRLYPAFWVAVTLSFTLISLFGHPFKEFYPSLNTYFLNMTMLHRFFSHPSIDGVYWSLTFELMFYFYMSLLMAAGLISKTYQYSVIWLLLSISITVAGRWGDFAFNEQLKGVFLLEFNSFFLTGIAIYKFHKDGNSNSFSIIAALSLVQQYLVSGVHLAIVYIVTTSLFLLLANAQNRIISVLAQIGVISYSLYLVHAVPGYTLINMLSSAGVPILFGFLITISTSFGVSYLIYHFVEVPSQRKMRNWFDVYTGKGV